MEKEYLFLLAGDNEDDKTQKEELLGRQDLYRDVRFEAGFIEPGESDRDAEGYLLAPNGARSNLPELEWKMTRTPSFTKFFGDWEGLYTQKRYELWTRFNELNERLFYFNSKLAYYEKGSSMNSDGSNPFEKDTQSVRDSIVSIEELISHVKKECEDEGMNPLDSGYSKVVDENGEPLLLYRGTDHPLDEFGNFTVPSKSHLGVDFQVGVFFGQSEVARAKVDQKNGKLYSAFVNCRNPVITRSKVSYSESSVWIDDVKSRHDGIWLTESQYSDQPLHLPGRTNVLDLVCFNPKDILIVDEHTV